LKDSQGHSSRRFSCSPGGAAGETAGERQPGSGFLLRLRRLSQPGSLSGAAWLSGVPHSSIVLMTPSLPQGSDRRERARRGPRRRVRAPGAKPAGFLPPVLSPSFLLCRGVMEHHWVPECRLVHWPEPVSLRVFPHWRRTIRERNLIYELCQNLSHPWIRPGYLVRYPHLRSVPAPG